jgi:hypothetical protein
MIPFVVGEHGGARHQLFQAEISWIVELSTRVRSFWFGLDVNCEPHLTLANEGDGITLVPDRAVASLGVPDYLTHK